MLELTGVIHISNISASLKKTAFLFDAIYATQEFAFTRRPRQSEIFNEELEFLQEIGFLGLLPPEIVTAALKRPPTEAMKREAKALTKLTMQVLTSPPPPKNSPDASKKTGPFVRLRPTPLSRIQNESVLDSVVRRLSAELNAGPAQLNTSPICKHSIPDAGDVRSQTVLQVAFEAMPLPDETSSWQDIFEFKEEMHDKQWAFRRFLNSLATKNQTEAEMRDDIEWSINEYAKAMKLHNLKAGNGFWEVYVIPAVEMIEDLAKINWSKLAKNKLSVNKRKVELMEAEMKAPGRECAYVFDVRKRFG